MRTTILALLAAMSLAACAAQPETAEQSALAEDGREIAEAQCAACHAIGQYGESPVPQAPTFRTVLSRYRADVLEEELIEGVQITHPMPDFQFNPQSADALIAYLQSIQEPQPAE